MKEMVGGCCVCSDEMGWHDNPLIYCDGPGCEVAVHQGSSPVPHPRHRWPVSGCYGIQEVPDGEWFCEKCRVSTSFDSRVNGLNGKSKPFRCELCPLGDGALKRTETGGSVSVRPVPFPTRPPRIREFQVGPMLSAPCTSPRPVSAMSTPWTPSSCRRSPRKGSPPPEIANGLLQIRSVLLPLRGEQSEREDGRLHGVSQTGL